MFEQFATQTIIKKTYFSGPQRSHIGKPGIVPGDLQKHFPVNCEKSVAAVPQFFRRAPANQGGRGQSIKSAKIVSHILMSMPRRFAKTLDGMRHRSAIAA